LVKELAALTSRKMKRAMPVALKRAYDPPSSHDGVRVLVDRLWPRGVKKEAAKVDLWLRDVAPSNELRKWFHERPSQWLAFRKKYLQELTNPEASAALDQLHQLAKRRKPLTLIFSAKNELQNNAVVLKELLDGMKKPPSSTGPGGIAAGRARARMPHPK
jgi:uncharacterized protein YeaO (DUF488 family)